MFRAQQLKLATTYTIILTLILGLSNLSIYVLFKSYNELSLSTELGRMLTGIADSEWLLSENESDEGDDKYKDDDDDDDDDEVLDHLEKEKPPLKITWDNLSLPKTITSFSLYLVYDTSGTLRYKGSSISDTSLVDTLYDLGNKIEVDTKPFVYKPNIPGLTFFSDNQPAFIVTSVPISPQGDMLGFMLLANDISQINQTFNRLIGVLFLSFGAGVLLSGAISYWYAGKALKPIKSAYDGQQTFLANVSHELKAPLSVMLLTTEALERQQDATQNHQLIQDLKDEVLKMTNQVNQLLFLAKVDSGALLETFDKTSVPISNLINQEIIRFQGLAKQKKIQLTTTITPHLHLLGSAHQLRSLVGILIENAVKYTPENGSIAISLDTKNDKKGNKIVLCVSDSGPGIDESLRNKVFERYYRADEARTATHSSDTGGFGLGLSIAREIVQTHQGSITIETSLWQGAKFVVTLPTS